MEIRISTIKERRLRNEARDAVTGCYTRTYWEQDLSNNWWCQPCGKGQLGKSITAGEDQGHKKRKMITGMRNGS